MYVGRKPEKKFVDPLRILNKEQQEKLAKVKKEVESWDEYKKHENIQKYCTDLVYYRFLKGFLWNVDNALGQIRKTVDWRIKLRPEEFCKKHLQFLKDAETPIMFPYGYDKTGHPILYLNFEAILQIEKAFVKIHGEDLMGFLVLITYMYEYCYNHDVFPEHLHHFHLIIDVKNIGLTWIGSIKEYGSVFKAFSDHYSESLYQAHLVNAGWTIRTVFAVVKMFMEEKTQQKYNVCGSFEDLKEAIDEDQIIPKYGGKASYTFTHQKFLSTGDEPLTEEPPQENN